MKARLFVAALAFVTLSSMAVAQTPAKSGCCQSKTECSQGKEAAKPASDQSTTSDKAKKTDTAKKAAETKTQKAV